MKPTPVLAALLFAAAAPLVGCTKHLVAPAFDVSTYTPVAILELEGDDAWDEELGSKLADAILANVYQNKDQYRQEAVRLEVNVSDTPPSIEFVDREHMGKVLHEQDFGATDRVDPATAARIGSVLGARAVLVGKIATYKIQDIPVAKTNYYDSRGRMFHAATSAHMSASYKIIDSATGKIVWVSQREANVGFEDEFYPESGEQPSLPNHQEVKARLLEALAHEIGRDFYFYFSY